MSGYFILMCLIWGSTWIAMKAGVAVLPPIFFGGTRFILAGFILLIFTWFRGQSPRLTWPLIARLSLIQCLMVVLTYAPLFWAIRIVPSGLTAVLDLALMPISLIGFGLLFGQERWSASRAAALILGGIGLGILFGPQIAVPTDPLVLIGAAAIIFSAVIYSLGSVLARPLTQNISAPAMAGLTMLPGGLLLTIGALLFEPGAARAATQAAHFAWPVQAVAGWLFLVLFGSLVAFTAYMRLIAAWGPARAGSYAYVSPVIAVALGVFVMGEAVDTSQAIGMTVLLLAAFFSVRPPARQLDSQAVTRHASRWHLPKRLAPCSLTRH